LTAWRAPWARSPRARWRVRAFGNTLHEQVELSGRRRRAGSRRDGPASAVGLELRERVERHLFPQHQRDLLVDQLVESGHLVLPVLDDVLQHDRGDDEERLARGTRADGAVVEDRLGDGDDHEHGEEGDPLVTEEALQDVDPPVLLEGPGAASCSSERMKVSLGSSSVVIPLPPVGGNGNPLPIPRG
jgi:hypothetical protein